MAAETRGRLVLRYLAELRKGPLSDVQASGRLSAPLSSICSTRNALGAAVVPSDQFEVFEWPNGRTTKRVMWRLA